MRFRALKLLLVAGIVAAVTITVSYVTSFVDILDLELVSVEGFRLKDVAELTGEASPETPVFRVRFTTSSDFVRFANQLDAYSFSGRVLVGDGGCNPDLDSFSYTNVAEMLIDFTRLYDDKGAIDNRGLWSSGAQASRTAYHFYFGVDPARFDEYVYLGLDEAPLCFEIAATSRMGRRLFSNIVPLPKDTLAKAAAPLDP
jgi:hypothetical protein